MKALSHWYDRIAKNAGATAVSHSETIQTLWSDYGVIARVYLTGGEIPAVIVKVVEPPQERVHPRGWNTPLSHDRKIRSYDVERVWYEHFSFKCNDQCRVPSVFGVEVENGSTLMVMEDLDSAGYPRRFDSLNSDSVKRCLDWLAAFHARFMGVSPKGLWPEGTYWHLATRPDELKSVQNMRLQNAAEPVDQKLAHCKYRTLVHGDAKVANFCFSDEANSVAAVDFQYVGGGCGMKDVAYLLGSCLNSSECEKDGADLLDFYFVRLRFFLTNCDVVDCFDELETEWRDLYKYAWTDFYRFLAGWMPEHVKINRYTLSMADEVYRDLSL